MDFAKRKKKYMNLMVKKLKNWDFEYYYPASSRAPLFWAPLMSALPKFEQSMSATHFKIEECRLSDTHFLGWVKSKSALFKKASEVIKFKSISFFFALRAKWYKVDILLFNACLRPLSFLYCRMKNLALKYHVHCNILYIFYLF